MWDFSFFCFLSISFSKPSLFLFSLVDVIKRQRPCGKTEFSCANHRCIPAELQCDFFDDCEDGGSDEHDCKACKCTSFCNPSLLGFCILWSKTFTVSHFVPRGSQILSMVRVEDSPTCAETTLSATIQKHLQSANAKMDFRETRKPSNVKVENPYKKCPVFRYSEFLSSFIKIQHTYIHNSQICLSDFIYIYIYIINNNGNNNNNKLILIFIIIIK